MNINEMLDYNPLDQLKTAEAILTFVSDIKATDELTTIASMLSMASEAAAILLEEEIRAAK